MGNWAYVAIQGGQGLYVHLSRTFLVMSWSVMCAASLALAMMHLHTHYLSVPPCVSPVFSGDFSCVPLFAQIRAAQITAL